MKQKTKELINKNNVMLKFCAENNYRTPDDYNHWHSTIRFISSSNQEHDKYVSENKEDANVSIKNGKFYVNCWNTSYHNGSTFGYKSKEITEDEYFIFAERASKEIFEYYMKAKKEKTRRDEEKAAAEAFLKKCEKELQQEISLNSCK